ncbi:hypothetical protein PRZ48_000610 [Zasmidium cellare]|uniref:C3H1-type domain-containing protein n=1 Tax=Zasmidium cellare TaxID=395010 RepID=A0ABR0EYY9_ZASCE|nr:hypothetical protein PRZ48_000610 [Zasmidium cellare]
MAKTASRDEVKMLIYRGTKGLEEQFTPTTEPPAPTSSLGTEQLICNYWYHGCCRQQEDCKFVHRLEPSLRLATRKAVKHKKPCGLDRCPWKNEVPFPKKKKQNRNDSVTGANGIILGGAGQQSIVTPSGSQQPPSISSSRVPSVANGQQTPVQDQPQGKKRKFFDYHYDDARQWGSIKAGAIDYDEPDLPSLIQQVLGGLQQCRQAEAEAGGDVVVPAPPPAPPPPPQEQGVVEPSRKRTKRVKASAANETCFFWYHGKCSRSQDAHRGFACPFLHELTDPPSMVQPPPGYVHREPCMRDWCPGDDRSQRGQGRSKRMKLGGAEFDADASKTKKDDGPGKEDSKNDDDSDKDSQPDWFLTGFEEPE